MSIIAVGIDGSTGSDAALAWACEEAKLRGAVLRAIHAYPLSPALPGVPVGMGAGLDHEALAEQALSDAFSRIGVVPDGVSVERVTARVSQGNAAQALIDLSKDADLLVVGSRGLGGFMGLLVGSVSQQCVSHAHCPVVVVPPSDRER